jgi:hypothetical protein
MSAVKLPGEANKIIYLPNVDNMRAIARSLRKVAAVEICLGEAVIANIVFNISDAKLSLYIHTIKNNKKQPDFN